MTSFFQDLEEQLREAAHERTSSARAPVTPPAPRRRRWLAGGVRLLPVAAAIAVTLAVVAGALVLLGHRGGHAPVKPATHAPGTDMATIVRTTSPSQLKREFALMGAAARKVQASPVCHVAETAPVIIRTPPGHALLSTLGLLRRPATPADRLPAHALDMAGSGVSIYAGAARRALLGGQLATFIVPIRQSPNAGFPSDRCFALQVAAVKQALPSMPAKLRAPTWALANAFVAYDRSLAGHAPIDGICEITILSHNGRSSGCGMTVSQIRAGTLPEEDNGTFSGLVPDGVASVTLRFAASAGHAPRTATVRVHDNGYRVHVAGLPLTRASFPTVTWRDASGKVLRTYSEPPMANPSSLKQLCAKHPATCVPAVLASAATTVHVSGTTRVAPSPVNGGG